MKTFEVEWTSPGNIATDRKLIIRAESIVQAQDKFLDWIKKQPIYQHMWSLNFKMALVGELIE